MVDSVKLSHLMTSLYFSVVHCDVVIKHKVHCNKVILVHALLEKQLNGRLHQVYSMFIRGSWLGKVGCICMQHHRQPDAVKTRRLNRRLFSLKT